MWGALTRSGADGCGSVRSMNRLCVPHRPPDASAFRSGAAPPFATCARRVSAAEQLDQFAPLTVGEAGERLCGRDPAAGEQTIGPGRTDPRDGQQQLPHLRRLRTSRRVGDHPRQLEAARGDPSLQLGALDANLVRLRERAQPLLARASKRCRSGAHNDTTPILRAARGVHKLGRMHE